MPFRSIHDEIKFGIGELFHRIESDDSRAAASYVRLEYHRKSQALSRFLHARRMVKHTRSRIPHAARAKQIELLHFRNFDGVRGAAVDYVDALLFQVRQVIAHREDCMTMAAAMR